MSDEVAYLVSPAVGDEELNDLFAASWPGFQPHSFDSLRAHSLLYVCATVGDRMVGFVNLAWDGGVHAFLLDTTTHPDYRHRGIGQGVVRAAVAAAKQHGIEWVHVDYEPHLGEFYRKCGFRPTDAGLINLHTEP